MSSRVQEVRKLFDSDCTKALTESRSDTFSRMYQEFLYRCKDVKIPTHILQTLIQRMCYVLYDIRLRADLQCAYYIIFINDAIMDIKVQQAPHLFQASGL